VLQTVKFKNTNNNIVIYKEINNIIFILVDFYKLKILEKLLKTYFVITFTTFYFRIIWRGKAYRVRYFRGNNKFTFNFGHSHWCKITYLSEFCRFFKLKRQNYIIFFSERKDIRFVGNFFNTIRFFNKYTRRGMRIKQIPTIRRFGKISQVNSSLHSFGQ
jgi:hypothetical protein